MNENSIIKSFNEERSIKKCYIDFDGTLVDSNGCWIKSYVRLCDLYNIKIDERIKKSFYETSFNDWIQIIKTSYSIEDVETKLFNCAIEVFKKLPIKQAVKDYIDKELKYYCITIISREPVIIIEEWLNEHSINYVKKILQVDRERNTIEFYKNVDMLIDDNFNYCKVAKQAKIKVVGVNDYHNEQQKNFMKEICDLYIE